MDEGPHAGPDELPDVVLEEDVGRDGNAVLRRLVGDRGADPGLDLRPRVEEGVDPHLDQVNFLGGEFAHHLAGFLFGGGAQLARWEALGVGEADPRGEDARRRHVAGTRLGDHRRGLAVIGAEAADGQHAGVELQRPGPLLQAVAVVVVKVDEPRNQELAARVDHLAAFGHGYVLARAGTFDAVAADDDDRVLDGRRAGAVDERGAGDRDRVGAVEGERIGGAGCEGSGECEGDYQEPKRNRMPAGTPAHPVAEFRVLMPARRPAHPVAERFSHSKKTSAIAMPLSPATA